MRLVLHLASNEGVKSREGFVHQQDVGVRSKGPGEADSLLHTAREFVGHRVGKGAEADQVERFDRCSVTIGLFDTLHLEAVAGVVDDRAVWEEREVLEHHRHLLAELLQVSTVELLHVGAIDHHATIGDVVQLVDGTNGRRLARS